MHYMKKLKIALQSNKLFYILLSVSIIYTFLFIKYSNINIPNRSNYYGYITDYNIDGDKLSLIIKSNEKILVNYYFKTQKDKNSFNLSLGDYIKVYGNAKEPSERRNFGLFDYKKYLFTKKINYIVDSSKLELISKNTNIFYMLKNKIILRIDKNYNTKNYIKAFIIGDKSEIDNNTFLSYQYLGVSHLLAVSGMHVSLISLLILKLLNKRLGNSSYFIVSLVLLFYLFLTNFTISMIRASLQFILFSINKVMKLNIRDTNIVIFLVCILLIYNPYYIYDVGFKFSFTISFSLILCKRIIEQKNNYITKLFTISLISFLTSIPILVNNFNQINFLSIFYNIIYVPFVSYIIFPISLISLVVPYMDNIYMYFINLFEYITKLLSNIKLLSFSISNIPIFFVPLYYIFLYSFIFHFKKIKLIILVVIFIILINYNRFVLIDEITFIDVGQGDSILIRIRNKNILIDTGGKLDYEIESWKRKTKNYTIASNTLIPYLKKEGVKQIDYLILTHGDYDHIGESYELCTKMKIKNIIINDYNMTNNEKKLCNRYKCKKYREGDILKVYNDIFYFLNPSSDINENENSLIILSKINNKNILFMGDASKDNEKRIISEYYLPKIDILKIGHHGSDTSTSKEFLDYINPKYAIISVGENNRYNHPSKKVIDRLNNKNINTLMTSKNGMIRVKLYEKKVNIKTSISYN